MSEFFTAADVLRRYKDEDLPEFCEIDLVGVNQAGNFGNYPIHVACVRGSMPEVQALIEGGADVNAIGELGARPLHDAVSQGHIDVVKALLQFGASRSEKNGFESTPLDVALTNGRDDIANVLR